jgi:hypothetical protein
MNELRIPVTMAEQIAAEATTCGQRGGETGGFLLAPAGSREGASVLALAGEIGVERRRDLFRISGIALAALFEWADDHDLAIAAQWHSHRLGAFLSETDLAYGFNVPGFRSAVVPNYLRASADPAEWGWWRYHEGSWQTTPAPTPVETPCSSILFEEGRVHAR